MAKPNESEQILHNAITNGTEIVGDINSQGGLRLDGFMQGNLNIKGRVVIGKSGKHIGTITCKEAEISGYVEGKIYVSDLLTLTESANVKGDIVINKLTIHPGCKFTGTCSMDGNNLDNETIITGKPKTKTDTKTV